MLPSNPTCVYTIYTSWLSLEFDPCILADLINTSLFYKTLFLTTLLVFSFSAIWSILYFQCMLFGSFYTLIYHKQCHIIWPWSRRLAIFQQRHPRNFEQWWQFLGHMIYIEGADWLEVFYRGVNISLGFYIVVGIVIAGLQWSLIISGAIGFCIITLFVLDTVLKVILDVYKPKIE